MALPQPNPISEEYLVRGAPLDLLGSVEEACETCGRVAVQDRYRAVMRPIAGIGAPRFARPFIERSSTAGKLGKRSEWRFCRSCTSFIPLDANAREVCAGLGLPDGFVSRRPWRP